MYYDDMERALAQALRQVGSNHAASDVIRAADALPRKAGTMLNMPGVRRVDGTVYSASRMGRHSSVTWTVDEAGLPALRALIARLTEEAAPSVVHTPVPVKPVAKATAA